MSGQLDLGAAEFLKSAISSGYSAGDVVADPDAIAAKLGTSISDTQRSGIRRLNDPDLQKRLTSLSPEAHSYMLEVVKDGRYLSDWKSQPIAVGGRLGLTVNPAIADEIGGIDLSDIIAPHGDPTTMRAGAATVISVAVAVIVAASADTDGEEMPIIDFSKLEKL